MEGLLIRGGREGEKGDGGSPGYYGFPGSRAARIIVYFVDIQTSLMYRTVRQAQVCSSLSSCTVVYLWGGPE